MTCPACTDRGLFPVDYTNDPRPHFVVCLCPIGEKWRRASNNGKPSMPFWQIESHRQGLALDQFVMLEDYATPEELAAFGFREMVPSQAIDAVAAAARARSRR